MFTCYKLTINAINEIALMHILPYDCLNIFNVTASNYFHWCTMWWDDIGNLMWCQAVILSWNLYICPHQCVCSWCNIYMFKPSSPFHGSFVYSNMKNQVHNTKQLRNGSKSSVLMLLKTLVEIFSFLFYCCYWEGYVDYMHALQI